MTIGAAVDAGRKKACGTAVCRVALEGRIRRYAPERPFHLSAFVSGQSAWQTLNEVKGNAGSAVWRTPLFAFPHDSPWRGRILCFNASAPISWFPAAFRHGTGEARRMSHSFKR